ncbi:Fap amyloid fiber secretin [Methylophaga thiooxydans]|uniref:Fap amyloid fiber secretin n=1 Tax=Methylophaga thiooxydans TaxID=392484 RepID=A0A0A0BH10_9GAMM|nr:transporter [Methylophaga thiooxydans]KGM07788.1 Fap amyloid fiber secretin [Methylophaga thiooxydans]
MPALKNRYTTLSLCIGMALATPIQAATDKEVEQLQQQVEQMQKRYEQQNDVLKAMAVKIQRLEQESQPRNVKVGGAQPQPNTSAEQGEPQGQSGTQQAQNQQGVVKEAPAARSTEAVYREQHTLFDRKFTIEPGITYSHSDRRDLFLNGFLALDAIFLGDISLDRIKADTWTFDLTGRYSYSDRLQFDVNVPYLYRDSSFSTVGAGFATNSVAEDDVSNGDFGDVSFGAFYRLFQEQGSRPDTVLSLRVKAPTGKDPYGIKFVEVSDSGQNLTVPTELPTGNGVWSLTPGISIIKTTDPAILFANFSYTYNFERSFSDISTSPDIQTGADVDLGDSYAFGAGFAFALNEKLSASMSYSHRITKETSIKQRGQSEIDVNGSDASAGLLNFGVSYSLGDNLTMTGNVGIGITPDAPDVSVGFRFPYNF